MQIAKKTNPSAYLLKPASKKQVGIAIDLAISNFQKSNYSDQEDLVSVSPNEEHFFLKTDEMFEKIKVNNIACLEAMGTYTKVVTPTKSYTVSVNLKNFLVQYKGKSIIRCQRSYAVNINHIKGFDDRYLFVMKGRQVLEIPYNGEFKSEHLSEFPRIKSK